MQIQAPRDFYSTAGYTLLLAVLYYLVSRLSLYLAIPPGYSTAIWPAAGLALAAVLLLGNRVAGGVFLGSLLANLQISQPDTDLADLQWLIPGLIATGSTVQAMLSKVLVSHFCRPPWDFIDSRQILFLIGLGGPIGCLISASNGNLVLLASGLIQPQEFFFSWLYWWMGDSLGVLVIAPLVLIWAQPDNVVEKRRKYTITAPLMVLFAAIVLLFMSAKSDIRHELEQRLTNDTTSILIHLKDQIFRNTLALKGLKSLYLSSEQVTTEEFEIYASSIAKNLDSLLAMAWAPRISQEELPLYQRDIAADVELKEFHQGRFQSLGSRPYYQLVTNTWTTLDIDGTYLGFDLLTQPGLPEVIQKALDQGESVAFGPARSLPDKEGYLLIQALNPEINKNLILAFVGLEELFASLEPLVKDRPLQVRITDTSLGTQVYGYSDNRNQAEEVKISGLSHIIPVKRSQLKFGPLDWSFIAALEPAYIADAMYKRLWPVLTAGFVIAGCLSVLIITTTGAQAASLQLVNAKTKELDNDRQFLNTLIENLPIILYVKDAKTREYLRFNKAASTYFHNEASRLKGKTREEAFADNMDPVARDPDDIVVQENRVVREKTTFHYQGKDYWFDSQKIPILNSDGEIQYILGLAEDITTETNTRRELLESKEYLSKVLNSVDEGIYGLNMEGQCTFVNEAACNLLGYVSGEWLGRDIHQLIHHKYKDGKPYPAENCPILAVFDDREIHRVTHEVFWHKDGTPIPVEYKSTPILDRGKVVGAVVVFTDISARKEVERLQKEHTQRLEQINLELEEFSFVASHDIQEPLRTLNCFCEFLVEDIGQELPEKAQIDIEYITAASQRMNLLINDMLEYSRAGRTALEMTKVPLQRCIENIRNDLFVLIKEHDATVLVEPGLPLLLGDEAQLTRVFQNLIHNAIKFRHPERKPVVRIGKEADVDEEFVWLTVKDNGIGIEASFHEQIFGAFRRLHQNEEYSGSGIGLAVVKKLVERHGGSLRIQSTPGEGTTFYIKLKKYPTESVMEEIAPPLYSSSQSSSS